ncbi:MAG: threonine synthase [Tissierellaceae bacterium]
MNYNSTRNKKNAANWSRAIVEGIAGDGGLFVPETFPEISDLESMADMSYGDIAYEILNGFLPSLEEMPLRSIIDQAYNYKFSKNEIVPLEEVGDVHILELFYGPTSAFKDMALSILPYLLKTAMEKENIKEKLVVLTATSGDTGKAALEGFAHKEGIKIIVFYPEKGVSEIQRRQMITQEGENTFVIGIEGNFDDAQRGVKYIFNHKGFKEELLKGGYRLSSANSINIGRLIPQIVYYFYSYIKLLKEGKTTLGQKINIVVPTGNFGNILAAYYGKRMGLPVNKLICASNENNVLYDFINTKVYDSRRELKLTSSPSMDILVSSNLERLLYHLSGDNCEYVKEKMEDLHTKGYYSAEDLDMEEFYGGYSTEKEVLRTIEKVFNEEYYLMDPHTAVAYNVYRKYKEETGDDTVTVIASTANPYKFGSTVAAALGLDTKDIDEFQTLELLEGRTKVAIPNPINGLKSKDTLHKSLCKKDEMKSTVARILQVGEQNG